MNIAGNFNKSTGLQLWHEEAETENKTEDRIGEKTKDPLAIQAEVRMLTGQTSSEEARHRAAIKAASERLDESGAKFCRSVQNYDPTLRLPSTHSPSSALQNILAPEVLRGHKYEISIRSQEVIENKRKVKKFDPTETHGIPPTPHKNPPNPTEFRSNPGKRNA